MKNRKFESGSFKIGIYRNMLMTPDRVIIDFQPIISFLYRIRRTVKEAVLSLLHEDVFILFWSIDCDMCESTTAHKLHGQKALNQFMEDQSQDAEGPQSYEIVNKEIYSNFTTYTRDRALEAFENGRGSSIYV